jgi:hypothetical protein
MPQGSGSTVLQFSNKQAEIPTAHKTLDSIFPPEASGNQLGTLAGKNKPQTRPRGGAMRPTLDVLVKRHGPRCIQSAEKKRLLEITAALRGEHDLQMERNGPLRAEKERAAIHEYAAKPSPELAKQLREIRSLTEWDHSVAIQYSELRRQGIVGTRLAPLAIVLHERFAQLVQQDAEGMAKAESMIYQSFGLAAIESPLVGGLRIIATEARNTVIG